MRNEFCRIDLIQLIQDICKYLSLFYWNSGIENGKRLLRLFPFLYAESISAKVFLSALLLSISCSNIKSEAIGISR